MARQDSNLVTSRLRCITVNHDSHAEVSWCFCSNQLFFHKLKKKKKEGEEEKEDEKKKK